MNKKFHITTFGCQMNEHDSEILAGMLEEMGCEKVAERKEANIVILNTCSVRENADKRFFGTLGQLKRRKESDPDFYVCVCGCMMQQQRIIDRLKSKYPWVDLVFGTHNIAHFPELIEKVVSEHEKLTEVLDGPREIVEGLPADRLHKTKALVNITYGCNNFCTYCIVPYTRGREVSRTAESILAEIRELRDDGVREVMLLGQNVNSYRSEDCNFSQLIRKVAEIEGIERIRFMTSHPKDLSAELIETFREEPKLCKYIHLPVQAGSDPVLKKMNRHYDRARYLDEVRRLREACPEITISTDIIVGFPGETEEDFQKTLEVVEEVRYDSAFTFLYSPREGTPAAAWENQIPEEVKHERFNRLVEAVDRISAEKNAQYEGNTERILIEGASKRNGTALAGRTDGFKLVNVSLLEEDLPEGLRGRKPKELLEELTGKFATVRITKGKTFSLEGVITDWETGKEIENE